MSNILVLRLAVQIIETSVDGISYAFLLKDYLKTFSLFFVPLCLPKAKILFHTEVQLSDMESSVSNRTPPS